MSSKNGKRSLKIYYGYHSNSTKRRPYIRLCGDYLTAFDFQIGDAIEITGEKDKITITKVGQPLPSEADLSTAGEQLNRNSLA